MRSPGVADVVRVYRELAKYRVETAMPETQLKYATGGNS